MIWICIKNVFVNTVLHLKNMLKFVMFVCFVHYLSSVHDNMLKYRIFQQYTVNTLKTLNNIGFSWSSLLGINIVRIAMTCFLFYYAIFLGVYVWLTGIFFPTTVLVPLYVCFGSHYICSKRIQWKTSVKLKFMKDSYNKTKYPQPNEPFTKLGCHWT